MTPGPEGPFRDEDEHPVLLPWLAAGTLDTWTARRIEEHVAACAGCRQELEALKSMAATLDRHAGSDHIGITELIDYGQAGAALERDRYDVIREHLAGCASCADEAEMLRSARHDPGRSMNETPGDAPARHSSFQRLEVWRWGFYAVAAVAVALVLPAVRGWRTTEAPDRLRETSLVRLTALTRGEDKGAILGGAGPWSLEILLPFGAPRGEYLVRVAPSGAAPALTWSARAHATADGRLSVYLPSIVADGPYILTAIPSAESGTSYEYSLTRSSAGP